MLLWCPPYLLLEGLAPSPQSRCCVPRACSVLTPLPMHPPPACPCQALCRSSTSPLTSDSLSDCPLRKALHSQLPCRTTLLALPFICCGWHLLLQGAQASQGGPGSALTCNTFLLLSGPGDSDAVLGGAQGARKAPNSSPFGPSRGPGAWQEDKKNSTPGQEKQKSQLQKLKQHQKTPRMERRITVSPRPPWTNYIAYSTSNK